MDLTGLCVRRLSWMSASVFVASSCLPELGSRVVCTLCERKWPGAEGKVTALRVGLIAWLGLQRSLLSVVSDGKSDRECIATRR